MVGTVKMRIGIGCDHAGFHLKRSVMDHLAGKNNVSVRDFGTDSTERCDYPDIAFPVAEGVATGQFDRGILICTSGVGMTIAANRIPEVRAVNAFDVYVAEQSRQHGDTNVICLGAVTFKHDLPLALEIVDVWLRTETLTDPRYVARIKKINTYWHANYAKLPGGRP